MHLLSQIITIITQFISTTGYPGIIVLMILESMIAPVPSEAVMPFAGFLISTGQFSFAGVIFWSTLGSLIGSLLSYYIGAYGGRPFIDKFGKYFFLNHHHLEVTEQFFARRGEITIFLSRFIPIVRHLISLPAGTGKMNIWKFSVYTILGAGLWNTFLAYLGFVLKNHWDELGKYSKIGDVLVILTVLGLAGYWLWKKKRKQK